MTTMASHAEAPTGNVTLATRLQAEQSARSASIGGSSSTRSSDMATTSANADSALTGDTSRGGSQDETSRSRPTTAAGEDIGTIPVRSNTLKKSRSISRKGSLRKSFSRRSSFASSVRSLALGRDNGDSEVDDIHNAFHTPVPTNGNPTVALADRFQAWRRVLKDYVSYFREAATASDSKAKSLYKLSATLNAAIHPTSFLRDGGILDTNKVLGQYYRQAYEEAEAAKNVYAEIIHQLTGLKGDLNLKIKEIKALSGDFRNSVDKEVENTKRAVHTLQEALAQVENNSSEASAKADPYIVRLGVERQLRRQIDEENYLHRAYLNLEGSGRQLEAIIVGATRQSSRRKTRARP